MIPSDSDGLCRCQAQRLERCVAKGYEIHFRWGLGTYGYRVIGTKVNEMPVVISSTLSKQQFYRQRDAVTAFLRQKGEEHGKATAQTDVR